MLTTKTSLFALDGPLIGERCGQVLTINVLVPMAAGIYPKAQSWLLWAVYSLFTSHVDIAFHTTVRAVLLHACWSCMVPISTGTTSMTVPGLRRPQ